MTSQVFFLSLLHTLVQLTLSLIDTRKTNTIKTKTTLFISLCFLLVLFGNTTSWLWWCLKNSNWHGANNGSMQNIQRQKQHIWSLWTVKLFNHLKRKHCKDYAKTQNKQGANIWVTALKPQTVLKQTTVINAYEKGTQCDKTNKH